MTEQVEASGASLRDTVAESADRSAGALAGAGDRLRRELTLVLDNLGQTSSTIDQTVATRGRAPQRPPGRAGRPGRGVPAGARRHRLAGRDPRPAQHDDAGRRQRPRPRAWRARRTAFAGGARAHLATADDRRRTRAAEDEPPRTDRRALGAQRRLRCGAGEVRRQRRGELRSGAGARAGDRRDARGGDAQRLGRGDRTVRIDPGHRGQGTREDRAEPQGGDRPDQRPALQRARRGGRTVPPTRSRT